MLQLSRTGIRNIVCNDTVYSDGLQYYKKNHVSNAAFSKSTNQYKISVNGNHQYQVLITEYEDGSFDYSCNCFASLKYKGACKHIVAALLFLLKYQEKSLMEAPLTSEEKRASQVMDYFINQDHSSPINEIYHIEPSIYIPTIMRGDESRAVLVLYVGNKRLYKVQAIKTFLQDMYNDVNIILGKEFRFIHGESEFDKSSKKLLDFLLDLFDISRIAETHSKLFNRSGMILTKKLLIKLLKILGNNKFNLEFYKKKFAGVQFFNGNPYLHYELDAFEDAIVFNDFERESVIPLIENGELIYCDGTVYHPDKRFIRNFIPFYNVFRGDSNSLIFRGKNMNKFLEEVLPKLHDTMDIAIPKNLKDRYLSMDMKPIIYLDKYNDNIKAELRFKYGEYEFNCFEEPKTDSYILVRQKEQEYELMKLLEDMDFEAYSNFYLLKNDDSIFEFLADKVHSLDQNCELYYSEDFKKVSVRNESRFKASIRLSQDINLLEMDLEYGDISKEELSDLFRAHKLKKKYFRLKSGSFIDLQNNTFDNMAEIFEDLNFKTKNLTDEPVKLSKSSIFYLQDALNNDSFIVEKDEYFTEFIDKILHPADNEYIIPNDINAKLHNYQITGFRWLSTLADNNLGGILADDMGLGKTLQAIVYITSRINENRKFLIVCPTSLVYNWLDEFESFASNIKAVVANGLPKERQALIESDSKYQVIITSYPLLRRDSKHYKKIMFDTVFIDEAQFIKNPASLNAQSVKELKSLHRFAMTGTPVENSLSELWSIFDFIMPNYLMSHSKFIERYEKSIMKNDEIVLNNFNKRIQPFILRRMKKDVLQELPDKTEEKILTEMTSDQKKTYLSYMENIKNDFSNESGEADYAGYRLKILTALMRLRQICCHPSTFIDDYKGGSGKLELLLQLLQDGIANGHRILVFSQFTSMLKIIEKELTESKISYYYLEGSTTMSERNEYVRNFNEGIKSVFLISLKAGGTGLNLVGADMVIHYDPWWNPAVEEQATDRAYRIGQEKNVHVIKLITKGTIEEKIYRLQKKKKELSDSVIQSKEVFINLLSEEELRDIFK